MQEKITLDQLMKLLSEDDRAIFAQLASKLKDINGDINQLSASELTTIQQMEQKYAEQFSAVNNGDVLTVQDFSSDQENLQANSNTPESLDLLQTPFADKVRQLLARDLKDSFPKEAEAAQFAFNNKWLPADLKDPVMVANIFDQFKQDISEANQWREELVGLDSDKTMAVGLTWFMVIFQLNQRLNS
ncbi:MAG: hypothetical protein Q9M92_12780 [Enterobacterales bacterium]|nr:hypothetical protein [Enterobacterales bacterium]